MAGVSWVMAVYRDCAGAVKATVSADVAVHTVLGGSEPLYIELINHGGILPGLPRINSTFYGAPAVRSPPVDTLAQLIRHAHTRKPA